MTSIRTKTALQCLGCVGVGAAYAKYRVEKKRFGHFHDFPNLEKHYSSMANHLTKTMHRHMKSFGQTPSGFTFDECIQPGIDIAGNSLGKKEAGIIAGDQECYTMFADLFNAVIGDMHPVVKDHAKSLDQLQLFNVQFDPRHVIAVKAQAFRNVVDFPYTPAITRGQRRKVEKMVADAVADLPSDLSGKYQQIKDLDRRTFAELAQAEVNFTKPTGEVDVVAQLGRDWPDARGLFVNKAKDFTVWVNGRHHVEVSAQGQGGDLGKVVRKVAKGALFLDQRLELGFQWKERFGFMGHDVTQIGTGLYMEAHVRLPKYTARHELIPRIAQLGLKVIPHSDEDNGIWRLTSRPTFETEVVQAKRFAANIEALVAEEKAL